MSAELQTALTPRAASEIEQSIRIKTDNLQRILLAGACDIGLDLTDLKAKCPHGEWGAVLKRLGYSSSTANNFMRLYDAYGSQQVSLFGGANCQTFGNLEYSKALALLAVPAEEREQFAEEIHAEELSVRELKAKIKEMENQAEGWKRKAELAKQTAEAQEEALAQAETNAQLQATQISILRKEKETAIQTAETHAVLQSELIDNLREENRILASNVEELKNRPVEVSATVDATEEQLREAEKRGREAAMLDAAKEQERANKKHQQAEESLKKQNQELAQALEAARLETDQYQGTNADLLQQLEAAKKSRVQADEPMVELKLLFKQLQETANAMVELLPSVDDVNRAKLKRALPGALRQLAERMEG